MRFSTSLAGALTLSAAHVAAQTFQSAAFNLVILSGNATLNGSTINACHEGAAIEGLCVGRLAGSADYEQFYLNSSTVTPGPSTTGQLVWNLPFGDGQTESEAMQFQLNPASNVVMPLFFPDYTNIYVGFDAKSRLYVPEYVDDTVSPPTYVDPPVNKYRWYSCQTYYSGYTYEALTWVLGKNAPQNPSCQKVQVLRVFV